MIYAWVDTAKRGEARARFTFADLRRKNKGNAEMLRPTPHTATIRLVELQAIEKKWFMFGGHVTCARPRAQESDMIAVRCPPP